MRGDYHGEQWELLFDHEKFKTGHYSQSVQIIELGRTHISARFSVGCVVGGALLDLEGLLIVPLVLCVVWLSW